jgi:predicted RecB family nuclease
MRILDGQLVLSPSDLSNFLTCRHRAGLDLAAARKVIEKPRYEDPYVAMLGRHGDEHERAYVDLLRTQGLAIVNAKPDKDTTSEESTRLTLEAMRAGAQVIVQARLEGDLIAGYADVLLRVETPSDLGAWSYEAQDTKLAKETKGGTILQLSAYSDMAGRIQGRTPEWFHVITPGNPSTFAPGATVDKKGLPPPFTVERYRVEDYAAYYRMVLATLRSDVAKGHEALLEAYYPEPVEACTVCAWDGRCVKRRRDDDHLSFIAGSGRSHRVELVAQGVPTLTAAAKMPVPVEFKPARGSRETYGRLGDQARVQHQQKKGGQPVYERLEIKDGEGLCRLPPPSTGDLFLDLEGARFAREGGREYLFGLWSGNPKGLPPHYRAWWALNDAEEQAAFEQVVDLIMAAWDADPGMHVYHFNHYEPTAFKKLMGRYVTRGEQLDRLLWAERFVDLYPIAKQAVRAGVESYSIKKLELYTGYTRRVELKNVHDPLLKVELALDANAPALITTEIRDAVQGYNEDDCRSTEALRDWLESLRADWEAAGVAVPRPGEKTPEAEREKAPVQQQAEQIRERILASLPAGAETPGEPGHEQWLLAYLVDWHRREVNANWWEYFRLMGLAVEDLAEEKDAIVGLKFEQRLGFVPGAKGKPTKTVIDRYSYPIQELEIGSSGDLHTLDRNQFGELAAHDRVARLLDIKKGPSRAELHPTELVKSLVVRTDEQQKSVVRLAERMLAGGDECGIQLLGRQAPRLRSGPFAKRADESEQAFAIRIVTDLDRTTLAIQGPPGAGKTYIGARMILALTRAGKKVGVNATSHKVIRNLLDDVLRYATPEDNARIAQKDDEDVDGPIRVFKKNETALEAILSGEVNVLGGTSWMWAREDFANTVDVLFVDEAGQVSLANVLAVSQAANSLVLLGDPQQLDQPEKASHPDGVGVSALQHVLGDQETMPADRGIFLPITWRMSPALTQFTSELFYEGKLAAKAGLENQVLAGVSEIAGSRLWMVPVEHDGCQSASDEEVAAVTALVEKLLAPGSMWINEKGDEKQLTAADLRIVAPFNAQVNRIAEAVRAGVQVGTVDKFQGQTCAVVIYSMATSRPEDAPRGMEFLYSLNRLNVATSRARCAVFLIASPRLFEPDCRTPRQMQLANALCRYREMADSATNHPLPTPVFTIIHQSSISHCRAAPAVDLLPGSTACPRRVSSSDRASTRMASWSAWKPMEFSASMKSSRNCPRRW